MSPNQGPSATHLERPNLPTSEFGARRGLLNGNMGDVMVPQTHLARWTRLSVFKGLGHRCAEAQAGLVLIRGPGAWPLMVKGRQHRICLEDGPFASERGPVFQFRLCRVLWFRGAGRLVPGARRSQCSRLRMPCCGTSGSGCGWSSGSGCGRVPVKSASASPSPQPDPLELVHTRKFAVLLLIDVTSRASANVG